MTYVSRRPPRLKQAEALQFLEGKPVAALLMAMRCVDADTEYLSPEGWRRIGDYTGGKVAEFRLDGTAHFVEPIDYIKSPVDHFWRFKTSGGVDQVLSDNHRILLCSREHATFGKNVGRVPDGFRTLERECTAWWRETSPLELIERGREFKDSVPTTFFMHTETAIDMTDDQLRLMVAFHADGSFGTRELSKIGDRHRGVIRIKKQYKKDRIRELLNKASIQWEEKETQPEGFTCFWFIPPRISKTYGEEWWLASDHQRKVIADEVCQWDGRTLHHRSGAKVYSSIHEGDVDFIQYCFVSTGKRASKSTHRTSDGTYTLLITGDGRTNNLALLPAPKPYENHDGFMYSFSVPSTYLVLRRNGKVFVTGNTGKTKVIIDDWGRSDIEDLLVIAPAGAYMPWAEAVNLDYPGNDVEVFTWVSKRRKKDAARLQEFLKSVERRVLLINVEAISSVKDARDLAKEFVTQRECMVVIDESVIIKNRSSECSKFIVDKLAPLAKNKRILTGLVSPQSPLDVYQQFRFLDTAIFPENWEAFRSRYCVIRRICRLPDKVINAKFESVFGLRNKNLSGGRLQQIAQMCWPNSHVPTQMVYSLAYTMSRDDKVAAIFRAGRWIESIPMIEGYQNIEELHERLKPYSYRVRLEDCYDMPASDYSFWDVEMTEEQEKAYEEMKLFATTQLSEMQHVTATNVITQILRLHQILCGHTKDEEGNDVEIPEKRTAAVVQLLEDYDGKAIIWCSYDADVRKLTAALEKTFGKGTVARFWGGNRDTREAEEKTFKTDPHCRFMISTPDAGGRGRTWDCADLVIYHSSRNNLDHRAQSEERPKAVGKTRPIAYVDMRVPGTVEDKIIEALRKKIDLADLISGDDYREWLI